MAAAAPPSATLSAAERGGIPEKDLATVSHSKLALALAGKQESQDSLDGSLDDHHHLFPRHGDKWRATYHNITAMLGAGVLGLPSTFAYLGWEGGVICLGLFLFVSWYTFILLVRMHELPPKEEGGPIPRRFDSYVDLTTYLLGPRWGWWSLVPFQTIVLYGTALTYAVTGGKNLMAVANLQGGSDVDKVSYWILIFCGTQLLFCLVPNFSELGWVSLMGAIMSAFYSVMGTVLSGVHPNAPNVNYNPGDMGVSTAQLFFGIFGALSTVAFAFGGHNIALEIQATLPAKPNESTVKPMMFSVHWAFVLTGIAYFAVSCSGFWAFGTTVPDNILDAIHDPNGAITAAHLAVVLHVLASYQVYLFPLFDATELWTIKKFPQLELEERPTRRFIVRTFIRWVYVGTTAFMGCLIPFFGSLMNLFGAAAITPTTFVLPPILWLYWKRPGRNTFDFWLAMVVAVVMTIIGVVGTIAAFRSIILSANTFKPFT